MRAFHVLDGGWRAEESRVESLSFAQEVERDASEMHLIEMGTPVPNVRIRFLSGRLAYRARMLETELRALTPDDAA